MNMPLSFESDARPPLKGWAPGKYLCKCYNCEQQFAGDKRALSCADCAYNNGWRLIAKAPRDTELFLCAADERNPKYGLGCFSESGDPEKPILWDWGWSFPPTHWKPLPEPPPAR